MAKISNWHVYCYARARYYFTLVLDLDLDLDLELTRDKALKLRFNACYTFMATMVLLSAETC